MYRLARSRPVHQLATEQLPTLVGALLVSELFYKFHSFTLECVAFLATWFVLDGVVARLGSRPDAPPAWSPVGARHSAPALSAVEDESPHS